MKLKNLLFTVCLTAIGATSLFAQADKTNLIANASFEDNIDDMATGWTYENGADTTVWHTINTDGDATINGTNICGLWTPEFGDEAISQTITGLDNGVYKVTADLMIGLNGAVATERLTTQRIFANNNSVLYSEEANYSTDNIAILTGTLGETLSYAGHPVSALENGPFVTCEVSTQVTDGTLKFGIKTNGTLSANGLTFPAADQSGWGWFKMDNFTLTYMGTETSSVNDLSANVEAYAIDGYIVVKGVDAYSVYNTSGVQVQANKQQQAGVYVVVTELGSTKVIVK